MSAAKTDTGARRPGRMLFAAVLLAMAPLAPLLAAEPDSVAVDTIPALADATARMTVPVRVNGQGPFAFIVDTGAEQTVVSDRLATLLRLPPAGMVDVHSVSGIERVERVAIHSLEVGSRQTPGFATAQLSAEHMGALGILGIDGLRKQQVTLDFAAGRMTVAPPPRRLTPRTEDEDAVIIVRARRKHGQLILTRAKIAGVTVDVIIDTGAQVSIGNFALRRRLRGAAGQPVTIVSVTGGQTSAEFRELPNLLIGGLGMHSVRVAFADVHSFHRFGLSRRPAMLLGMDALRALRRVTIDFQNRTVRFALPDPAAPSG